MKKRHSSTPVAVSLIVTALVAVAVVGCISTTNNTSIMPSTSKKDTSLPVVTAPSMSKVTASSSAVTPTAADAVPKTMDGFIPYLYKYVPRDAWVWYHNRQPPHQDQHMAMLEIELKGGSDAAMKAEARQYARDFAFAVYRAKYESNLPIDCLKLTIWTPGKTTHALYIAFGDVLASTRVQMWSNDTLSPDAFIQWVKQSQHPSSDNRENVSIDGIYA